MKARDISYGRFGLFRWCVIALLGICVHVRADSKFDTLVDEGKFAEALQYYTDNGKHAAAIEYAEEQIPPPSRTVEIWIAIANAYAQAGEDEKAMACYQEAQKANPSHPDVYLAFGQINLKKKKYEEAMKHYQKSYLLERTAEAAEGLAICAARLKQWDKARDAAESAVNLDKDVLESRFILADLYLKEKAYKPAAKQLEVIVTIKPDNLKYWKQLAQCYKELGDKVNLARVDPEIIKRDKKDVQSRQRMAEYALNNNDTKTAFRLLKELAILTPDDPEVFQNLYQIAAKKGDTKAATLYLKNYIVLDSTHAESHKAMGDLLYEQDD
ncbi:MAG: tetratricopeptide repeat protein, partial [Chitinivibrionales bacterium]|nr:tetratricopeptide repeat protein [Chitinivibrionales bacterium]